MVSAQYVKDEILNAMRELTPYSYDDGWLLSRALAPLVSVASGRRVSSKSIGKHLALMEADCYVEKLLVNPSTGLHKWRLKDWTHYGPT